ncbi:cation:proton antiporter [Mucilaginibacter auburnensis]|uniref:CPA1 family monovalent cation:H+ antiporter n=1 Tax=Mucilaginibacter auburnensis TaxID=1457233 RepID=A0A2H9VVE5_9SPHI|nr:sodium:proton antiporter [Mucilaginibacter auburnensis]PJJ84787.1 CPA1 family monovalent cation:H+ antiporter [Mucilaginibacter auburnensis]
MDLFALIALLVIVSAFYSYINARFVKLPGTIGVISVAIIGSILTIAFKNFFPDAAKYLTLLARNIDFSEIVLNIMLGFLLFAGAFTLNVKRLKKEMRPVFLLSTIGVILSCAIFGVIFYGISILFDFDIPLVYCFLFGALISPTDPVAVSAIIKNSKLPDKLETIITGESLFNDGIGLVLFITLLQIARTGTENIDVGEAVFMFIKSVFGGIFLGLLFGFIAFRLMKSINDFQTIVLVSLALVMSISVICAYLEFSIPLAIVSAGLFAGNRSINYDNTERSHQSLEKFWELIDEILNTLLFVMIGLQMINLPFLDKYWLAGAIGIVAILVARWLSIMLPLTFLRRRLKVNYRSVNILTWAGLRGGISIALALALPNGPYKHTILAGAYFIVIFSVIVQGLTLNKLINSADATKVQESD